MCYAASEREALLNFTDWWESYGQFLGCCEREVALIVWVDARKSLGTMTGEPTLRTDLPKCPFCGSYPREDAEGRVNCGSFDCPIGQFWMKPERWKMRA
jgi:hypothetical protein